MNGNNAGNAQTVPLRGFNGKPDMKPDVLKERVDDVLYTRLIDVRSLSCVCSAELTFEVLPSA